MKKTMSITTISIFVLIGCASPSQNERDSWIKPSTQQCIENGGRNMYEGGVQECKVEYQEAKRICKILDARLPTIEELSRLVPQCGGKLSDATNLYPTTSEDYQNYQNNNYNNQYAMCMRRKGFSWGSNYWSSTRSRSSNFWTLEVSHGSISNSPFEYVAQVRCIRAK